MPLKDKAEPPLPSPGLGRPFKELVDAYTSHHGISKMETFRRISDATGSPTNTLRMRYYNRGDKPWVFAAPSDGWLSLS